MNGLLVGVTADSHTVELEFFNFQTPTEDGYGVGGSRPDVAGFLANNAPGALRPITQGMFGYSMTRPTASKKYFYDIFNTCVSVGCDLEIQHTESGPGVYEAVCAPPPLPRPLILVTLGLTATIGFSGEGGLRNG